MPDLTDQHPDHKQSQAVDRAPLSSSQLRVLLEHDLDPASRVYHYGFELKLLGPLDVDALERALEQLVDLHEPLRTTIEGSGDDAVQVVHSGDRIVLNLEDFSAIKPYERSNAVYRAARQLTRAPMDLRKEFPFRLKLLHFAPDDHSLVFMLHHIAIDAWSMGGHQNGHWKGGVFVRHLSALYEAARLQPNEPPRPPAARYRDYAIEQSRWRESEAADRATDAAAKALSDATLQMELPADRIRKKEKVAASSTLITPLPDDLATSLRRLAREEGATLFMVCLSAFAAELGRTTGQNSVTVITSSAGRDQPQFEDLIGNFINLMPICVDLNGDPTFSELLARTRRVVVESWGRHKVPFERLTSALGERLPRVLIELQPELMGDAVEVAGVSMLLKEIEREQVDYDLNVVVTVGLGIDIVAHYSRDLFDRDTVDRFVKRFISILERGAGDTSRKLAALRALSPQERELLEAWGNGPPPLSDAMALPVLLDRRARETGNQLAVVSGATQLTYRELAASVRRLTARLLETLRRPDSIVAIHAPRGPEFLMGILSTFKAGAAYLPLSPSDPPERRRRIMEASGASIILVQGALDFALPPGVEAIALSEAETAEPPVGDTDWPPHRSDGLAYVIYTSGSTGTPKGAMVEQAGMLNHLHAKAIDLKLTGRDRVAQTAPVSFDIAVWQFLLPLFVGGVVHLYDDTARKDPALLLEKVEQDGVTVLEVVPSFLAAMLDIPVLPALSRLRWLVVTGEALAPEITRRWFARFPTIPLVNAYGPTECSDDVSHHVLAESPLAGAPCIPIGRPVAGTNLYVLDPTSQHAPVGVPGELYVAGVGVGRGYLRDPRTTAEAFVPDDLSDRPGGRLYRTGDRARFISNGRLEFLGRLDHQVKLRGHRLEIGEIEAVLSDHPDVRQAVVLRREWSGADHLVAFVGSRNTPLTDAGRDELAASIRTHASRLLPAIMVPSLVTILDDIPLTPNGKANRNLLEKTPLQQAKVRSGPPPTSRVERLLADIWSEVLNVDSVSLDDNFFALGGDSIQLLRAVARAARVGISITPQQVFARPTLGALAEVAGASDYSVGDHARNSGPVTLTPMQQWLLAQPMQDPSHWNLMFEFDVPERFSASTLEAGLRAVFEHHEVLRLRLQQNEMGWRLERQDADIGALVESHHPNNRAELEGAFKKLHCSLSVTEGPLLRAARIEHGGSVVVAVVVHHLIVDGLSLSIFLEDFAEACGQIDRAQDVDLLPSTTPFRFCGALLQQRADEADADLCDKWRSLLNEARPFPLDDPDGVQKDTEGARRTLGFSLTEVETQDLRRQTGMSPPVPLDRILLMAVGHALSAWSPGPTLINIETDGRLLLAESHDVSRTAGPLSTIVPLVLDLPADGSTADRLDALMRSFGRLPGTPEDYGLLRYIKESPALSDAPVAEVSFDYLGSLDSVTARRSGWRLRGLRQDGARDPLAPRPYRLEFQILEVEKRLRIDLRYGPSVFSETSISRLGDQLRAALDEAIAYVRNSDAQAIYIPTGPDQANWTRTEVETLHKNALQRAHRYDDLVPLTPLQQGLLFHAVKAPESGIYVTQAVWTANEFDLDAMLAAWAHLLETYPVLKSSVLWESVPEPVLVAHRDTEVPVEVQDWRQVDDGAGERFEAFLAQDRRRGIDISVAPMMRVTAIRLADAEWRILWTHHHLLLDGWSVAELLKRLAMALRPETDPPGHEDPPSRSFAEYVRWLYRQDNNQKSQAFWRSQLEAVRPTPLPLTPMNAATSPFLARDSIQEATESLQQAETATLEQLARSLGVTFSTLVRAAWSMVLARTTDTDKVLFGVVASGRTAGFRGAQDVVGMLVNTSPFVAPVPRLPTVRDWLHSLHQLEAQRLDHERVSLTDIKRWSGWPGDTELFSTLVVFQNYPAQHEFADLRLLTTSNYPLVVRVIPGERLRLMLLYEASDFSEAAIHTLLSELKDILNTFHNTGQTVGDALNSLSSGVGIEEQRRILRAVMDRTP